MSRQYSLEQLLDPTPCELTPEARLKIGPAGADADSALLCGVCPKVVLAPGERLACELPFDSDAVAVSIPPSRLSAGSFNVTFGSFTKPNAPQAVVIANVDEHDSRARSILMERRERRWHVLGTQTSEAVARAPVPATLRDGNGRHLLIGAFQTDVASRLDVRVLRLSDEHVEAVNLLGLGDCAEPSTLLTNRSRSNHSAIGIRAAGARVAVHAQTCPTSDARRRRSTWVELNFEYDGAQFTATRATRALLKQERALLEWQTSEWTLRSPSEPEPAPR